MDGQILQSDTFTDLVFHEKQGKAFEAVQRGVRNIVINGGRRSGKSKFLRICGITWAIMTPGVDVVLLMLTLKQAKDTHWRSLVELCESIPGLIPPRRGKRGANPIDKSAGRISLYNQSRIILGGVTQPDTIRGLGEHVGGLIEDECSFIEEEVHNDITKPIIVDRRAPQILGSSPWGHNWFYKKYCFGDKDHRDYLGKEWYSDTWTILDNTFIPHGRQELEDARRELGEDSPSFRREWLAQWEGSTNRVFPTWSSLNITPKALYNTSRITLGCLDFGFNCSFFCPIQIDPVGNWIIYDEIVGKQITAREHAMIIAPRQQKERIQRIYADDAGRQRNYATGERGIDIYAYYGVGNIVPVPKAQGDIKTFLNVIRQHVRGKDNKPHLFVHPKCKYIINCFESLEYKNTFSADEHYEKGQWDHGIDAIRYFAKGILQGQSSVEVIERA